MFGWECQEQVIKLNVPADKAPVISGKRVDG